MLKKNFVLSIFISLMLCFTLEAQTTTIEKDGDNAIKVTFDSDVDSLDTVTSDWFTLPGYIAYSSYDYPVHFTKIQTSTAGKPYVTATLEGSNDQVNIVVVDTIGTIVDSLETLYSSTINLNNKKLWYFRVKHKGESVPTSDQKNRSDTVVKTDLLFITPKQ